MTNSISAEQLAVLETGSQQELWELFDAADREDNSSLTVAALARISDLKDEANRVKPGVTPRSLRKGEWAASGLNRVTGTLSDEEGRSRFAPPAFKTSSYREAWPLPFGC